MKKKFKLLPVMRYFISLCFLISLMVTLVVIGFDIFSTTGTWKSFSIDNHHSKGYSIPVHVNISVPDSIVSYFGDGQSSQTYYYRNDSANAELQKMLTERGLINTQNLRKDVLTNTIRVGIDEENSIKMNPEVRSKGYIIGKMTSPFNAMLQIIYAYSSLFILVLIFYQLTKILSDNISFSNDLVTRVRWLGLILVSAEIIKTTIIIYLWRFYEPIFINSYKNEVYYDSAYNVSISPRFDFNLTLFIVGLMLLLLGALFKKGYRIQQENDLTI